MLTRRLFLAGVAPLALGATANAVRAQDRAALKFELYKDAKGQYRWRLKSANGQVLATGGQGYQAKADCKHSIQVVQQAGAPGSKTTFETYEDAKKEYRWRLKASNGQVMAGSSEAYKVKADCEKAVALVRQAAAKAPVAEVAP